MAARAAPISTARCMPDRKAWWAASVSAVAAGSVSPDATLRAPAIELVAVDWSAALRPPTAEAICAP